jgi:hypothetical protein
VPALLADRLRGFDLASLYAHLLAMQADFSNEFDFCDFLAIAFVRLDFENVLECFWKDASGNVFTRRFSDHVGHFPIFRHKVKNDFHGSIFKVYGFRGTEPCFNITRPAEGPACDGDGKAKQGHKGKGKEKFGGFQITPLSIMQSACKLSNLASCFAVIAPP